MSTNTVTTWTCDGCGESMTSTSTYPPRQNWLQATFRRQTSESSQQLHSMLICIACQERMLDSVGK